MSTLNDGLIAYYKLENTADSVGTYTLTNTGSTPFADGKINNGADFGTSNTTKYLSIDSTLGMTGATAKTYSFWGKVNTAPPNNGDSFGFFRHLYGGAADGNYANVFYRNNVGVLEVAMPTSPAGMYIPYTLTVGTWFHFAVTVPASNTGSLTCYVNGVSIGTTANWSQNYALTTRHVIGADHAFGSKANAAVDEFGIWNRVLSAGEIELLYNRGFGKQAPFFFRTTGFYNPS